jgi:hypothetical protein
VSQAWALGGTDFEAKIQSLDKFNISHNMLSLLKQMLQINPTKRPTAAALLHSVNNVTTSMNVSAAAGVRAAAGKAAIRPAGALRPSAPAAKPTRGMPKARDLNTHGGLRRRREVLPVACVTPADPIHGAVLCLRVQVALCPTGSRTNRWPLGRPSRATSAP